MLQFTYETIAGTLQFGPAFNKTFLKEVFRMQEAIEAIGQQKSAGLENICFAPMVKANEERELSDCAVQSIYGYFENSMEKFEEVNVDPTTGFNITYLDKLDKCLS